jgi:glutamyl-tRNA synthetase|tara:strand:+ start:9653 stop:11122 length:1470 start_codon:yes stop_codon:yes gene_type:complete
MNNIDKVRVRFAPSPTGNLHIGGVRTAIFNWLFAKANQGTFILRIEDTDRNRYDKDSEDSIISSLKWLGITWDEGPIRQSEKKEDYIKVAKNLIDTEWAYYDDTTPEELEELRKQQIRDKKPPRYDNRGRYKEITHDQYENNNSTLNPIVIRLKVPDSGAKPFYDEIRGNVSFDLKEIDDFVILKSDGMPTYHLAHVVDDHEMKISHVIRGEEWISSTPRHVLIHDALDWSLPKYVHVPLILGKDKSKLSKRHGAESALEYKDKGYLPEALLNFLALLGWSPGDNKEIMDISEIIEKFSIKRILGHPAVFDAEKLEWMNASYIRNLKDEELSKLILNEINKDIKFGGLLSDTIDTNILNSKISSLVPLIKERLKTFSESTYLLKYFFYDDFEIEKEKLLPKKVEAIQIIEGLKKSIELINSIEVFDPENLEDNFRKLAEELKLKAGQLFFPIRIALTGRKESPPLFDTMKVIGRESSIKRLNNAINILN